MGKWYDEPVEKTILRTLAYADIFDYPLTSEEIFRFLITDNPVNFGALKKTLDRMDKDGSRIGSDEQGELFFLRGRKELVSLRKIREKISQKKLKLAQKIACLLKIIPTIKLIGVTGRLAMKNAESDDDIDFLIITSGNRLWLTRLMAVILLELLGKRRRPKQERVKNKICLNMFLDEDWLILPPNERDLYTAHEVVQLRPLWDRNHTHTRFLEANQWVSGYLPNAMGEDTKILGYKDTKTATRKKFLNILTSRCLNVDEVFARNLQFWYMGKHRTTEIVSSHRALFHPESARDWVLAEYKRRLIQHRLS